MGKGLNAALVLLMLLSHAAIMPPSCRFLMRGRALSGWVAQLLSHALSRTRSLSHASSLALMPALSPSRSHLLTSRVYVQRLTRRTAAEMVSATASASP